MTDPSNKADLLRDAIRQIRLLRDENEALASAHNEPIAIVGMGCRLPKDLATPQSFWEFLRDGKDAVDAVPTGRWGSGAFHDANPDAVGKTYATTGAFLNEIEGFDAEFFHMGSAEASSLDPQQRLLLEVSWEALENAGIAPTSLGGSKTGVFVSLGMHDYELRELSDVNRIDAFVGLGSACAMSAGRIAYHLGLEGPAMVIDTACSSSLVSVHLACQSLRAGESDLALAGGVNILLEPEYTIWLSRMRALSPTGRCRPFDAGADGYVRGEGCGIVALRRLSDAVAKGDSIVAIIRGSAINQAGERNGLTAPSPRTQEVVIRRALAAAQVDAADIGYVETHGTGTPLGDPIEIQALAAALGKDQPGSSSVVIGALKSNMGHLEAAAGIAGLMKTALILEHGEIPKNLHFDRPNPHVAWDQLNVAVPTANELWPGRDGPRRAGVSAFGFSGTNAHLILEQAPAPQTSEQPEAPSPSIMLVSALDDKALADQAARYAAHLRSHTEQTLADVCFTAAVGRAHMPERIAVLGSNRDELVARLEAASTERSARTGRRGPIPKLAFLFTGQGSLYAGVGRGLYDSQPEFRETIDRAAAALAPYLDRPLLAALFAQPGDADAARLDDTNIAQPALFVLQYALARLWLSWGVKPDFLLGHSVGELAAACVAGVFSLADGLRLVAARGQLMQRLPAGGAMAAVDASEQEVRDLFEKLKGSLPTASIAAVNGPAQVVVSGTTKEVDELVAHLERDGRRTKRLSVSHAFHSRLMDPMLDELHVIARSITYHRPRFPIVSSVTGQLADARVSTPDYWIEQVRATVRFGDGLLTLDRAGVGACLEIGPRPTLLALAREVVRPKTELECLPALHPDRADWEVTATNLTRLHLLGVAIDWAAFYRPFRHRPVSLPTYAFQRKRLWHERTRAVTSDTGASVYELAWRPSTPAASAESAVQPTPRRWLLVGEPGEVLARELKARGEEVVTAADAAAVRDLLDKGSDGASVVYLPGSQRTSQPSHEAMQHTARLLELGQTVLGSKAKLWVVTTGAQSVGGDVNAAQAALWGLARSFALEHADAWGGLVDLDPAEREAQSAAGLLDVLLSDHRNERAIAIRGGKSFVPRLVPVDTSPEGRALKLDPEATYLITGGLGGLGLEAAKELAQAGARHLCLVGRSVPSTEAHEAIRALESGGAKVETLSVDVSKEEQVEALFAALDRKKRRLAGVIHAAGAVDDGAIANQTAARIERVFAAKVAGGWNLHLHTADRKLDFFVLYSSIAGVFGSAGQSNYAAANAFLDALAQTRKAEGLPALSVAWGPWSETGIAASADWGRLEQLGLGGMSPADGRSVLRKLLLGAASPLRVVLRAKGDLRASKIAAPFFDESGAAYTPPGLESEGNGPREPTLFDRLLGAAEGARSPMLNDYLEPLIAKYAPGRAIEGTQTLVELGLDSLAVSEILAACGRELGLKLYAAEYYRQPSFQGLVDYLLSEFEQTHASPHGPTAKAPVASTTSTTKKTTEPRSAPRQRNPRMVFLLTSPRSGSTLLRVMLAGHPALFSPPELYLLRYETMGERARALQGTALHEGLERTVRELLNVDGPTARAHIDGWTASDTSTQEVFAELQRWCAPRLLVDKTPAYGDELTTLLRAEETFEDAFYIHLVRHPYSMIESMVRQRFDKMLGRAVGDVHQWAEREWTGVQRNTGEFLQRVDRSRWHRVRYEDLVQNPEAELRALSNAMGLEFDPALLNPYDGRRMTDGLRPGTFSIGDPNFHEHDRVDPSLGEVWKKITLPHPLTADTEQVATELGYELPNQHSARQVERRAYEEIEIRPRGVRLCVCTWGKPEGRPIVCVHGMLDHGAAWDPVARSLADRGYYVLAPDLRGHGNSEHAGAGRSYHVLDFVADIDAVLFELVDVPVTLVGHSMGAIAASLFASARPERVRSLFLVEPPSPPDEPVSTATRMKTHLDGIAQPPPRTIFPDAKAAAELLRRSPLSVSLGEAEALRAATRLVEPCAGGVRWKWDPLLLLNSHPDGVARSYLQVFEELRMPVQVALGIRSTLYSESGRAKLRAALPRPLMLDGGHNLHWDVPEPLADAIADAVAGVSEKE